MVKSYVLVNFLLSITLLCIIVEDTMVVLKNENSLHTISLYYEKPFEVVVN